MSAFIRKADDESTATESSHVSAAVPQQVAAQIAKPDRRGFAEEFMKLAKLKEQGVLSDTEFATMKSALINQAKSDATT